MRKSAILVVTIGLAFAGGPPSASAMSFVGPSGKVGGKDHAGWLKISWQAALAKDPDDHECETVRGVRMLFSTALGPKTVFKCSMSAGTPLYVNLPSTECSTIEEPPFHGDTPAELKACADEQYNEFFGKVRVVIDGKALKQPQRWITSTNVFKFRMPKKNILGTKKRRGKAAAYGAGVFVKGLKPGKHVLRQTVIGGGQKAVVIQRITVA